jgi:hypothetical protein
MAQITLPNSSGQTLVCDEEDYAIARSIVGGLRRRNQFAASMVGLRCAGENIELRRKRRRRSPIVADAIRRRSRVTVPVADPAPRALSAPAVAPPRPDLQDDLERLRRGISQLQDLADRTESLLVRDANRRRREAADRKLRARG